jgi:hypothetical protein
MAVFPRPPHSGREMPQAHTLAVPATTRAPRLMPLIVIFTAAALFALAFVIGSGDSTPAPKEAAAAKSSVSTARPDESKLAAAIAGVGSASPARPDESKVAAAIAGVGSTSPARPDESTVAAAISSGDASK